MMFCPQLNGDCKGPDCCSWNHKENTCQTVVAIKEFHKRAERDELQAKLIAKSVNEQLKSSIFARLIISRMINDPSIPEEERQILAKALEEPTAEAAERLLNDAGLL